MKLRFRIINICIFSVIFSALYCAIIFTAHTVYAQSTPRASKLSGLWGGVREVDIDWALRCQNCKQDLAETFIAEVDCRDKSALLDLVACVNSCHNVQGQCLDFRLVQQLSDCLISR